MGDDTYCTVDDAGPYPIEEIHIKEYKYDVDIRTGIRTPVTDGCYPVYFTYDNNEVKTIRREYGIGQFRQVFDFKKFPFDKQKLKISITSNANSSQNISHVWPKTGYGLVHFVTPERGAFLGLEEYVN